MVSQRNLDISAEDLWAILTGMRCHLYTWKSTVVNGKARYFVEPAKPTDRHILVGAKLDHDYYDQGEFVPTMLGLVQVGMPRGTEPATVAVDAAKATKIALDDCPGEAGDPRYSEERVLRNMRLKNIRAAKALAQRIAKAAQRDGGA